MINFWTWSVKFSEYLRFFGKVYIPLSSISFDNGFGFSVPIVLVGNKTDLHLERKISTDEGKRLAERWRAAFVETSAKRNEVCLLSFAIYSAFTFMNNMFNTVSRLYNKKTNVILR